MIALQRQLKNQFQAFLINGRISTREADASRSVRYHALRYHALSKGLPNFTAQSNKKISFIFREEAWSFHREKLYLGKSIRGPVDSTRGVI